MSSKIDAVAGSRSASPGAERISRRSQASTDGAATEASAGTDSVHITDTASQLASLEQAVRDLPAVDEARVATLRSAIEQGTYTVQPGQVADQLMDLEQSLGALGTHA